jgi:hypothetical protein
MVALALVVVAVGIGSFFAGRASVSSGATNRSPLDVAGFRPVSVSFVSQSMGWALGAAPCGARACPALVMTVDGGGSWTSTALPHGFVSGADSTVAHELATLTDLSNVNVLFADSRNGWIFGTLSARNATRPVLWSTHDGGAIWHREQLGWAQGAVFDLAASDGTVQLLAPNKRFGVTIESSPVARDEWRVTNDVGLGEPAGGGPSSGAFILEGSNGWLVEGNDRGTTGSARLASDGRWTRWTPPCSSVGHSFAIPAASSRLDLVALCTIGGFAYPVSKSAPPGATLGSEWLYRSTDGGATFTAGPEVRPATAFYGPIFTSTVPGVIFLTRDIDGIDVLVGSFDGGAHWSDVYDGYVTYVDFMNASRGIGLVRSANGTPSMIMTTDGGKQWRPVTF